MSAAIIVKHLLKENIPIEWFHVGDELCSFEKEHIDAFPNVTRVDVFDTEWQKNKYVLDWWTVNIGNVKRRHLLGYMIKPFALMTTQFKEVILLDADNFPLQPVKQLFKSRSVRNHHSLFWPEWRFVDKAQFLKYGHQASVRLISFTPICIIDSDKIVP